MPIENLIKKGNRMRYWRLFFLLCLFYIPIMYAYLFSTKSEFLFPMMPMAEVIGYIDAGYYADVGIELVIFTAKYFLLIFPSLMVLSVMIIEGYDLLGDVELPEK